MNKIAFISDIHGNYPALKAVLSDIDKRQVDQIICLGDLVGYYSMINEVIEEISKRSILCLMGNHDYAMVHAKGVIERSKTCTNILSKQLSYITPENLAFISNLAKTSIIISNEKSYYCVHGGLQDPIDEYLFEADAEYFHELGFENDFLVTGHTHTLINNKIDKITHINPGSVGQPRDGDNRSSYLISDGFINQHHRVEYNIDEIANDMYNRNYDRYIYVGLYSGKKIG